MGALTSPQFAKPAQAAVVALPLAIGATAAHPDEFARQGMERSDAQFMQMVQKGLRLRTDPRFQKQIGRVVTLPVMIDGCIRKPLEEGPSGSMVRK
jgi:hypothetical protein